MPMDESTECQTISPAEVEVLDIDILVRRCLPLAPEQETLLGGHLLHGDVLDGEPQDNGPDHSKGHLDVSVNDFFSSDGHQFDTLAGDEIEGFVDIGNFVKPKMVQK